MPTNRWSRAQRYHVHWAAEFRRQRTYRLQQSATSTTFARSVAEHLEAGTEDASLLIRPATLSRFETLPLLINLPTYLLYLLMSTFWRNWDFDTAWWPEHFPISGQSVISVYRRNEQNDYWRSSSNLSGCTKALCPFHLVHEGFKSGRWIIPMPTF